VIVLKNFHPPAPLFEGGEETLASLGGRGTGAFGAWEGGI